MTAAFLDPYLADWLDLGLRLLHVVAAIAWIGASFYFVLLDQSLRAPEDPADVEEGVAGELWEVHGGGFYHVRKFRVAPRTLPAHLAWFKWEAYTTWLSGFALLVVLYYLDVDGRLVDPGVADLSDGVAVGLSVGLLVVGFLVYELLCRALRGRELLLAVAVVALTTLAAWGSTELFAARAAFLQVGAMLGTIMAANVLVVIIPAHWELIRAKQAGREPDPAPGLEGKRRSVHNNYLTLPVLLTMLAAHFSFVAETGRPWLVLVALMLLGAWARLFYNLRHAGRTHWWMPPAALAAVVALALVARPEERAAGAPDAAAIARGETVFAEAGCGSCHTLAAAGASGGVGPSLDGLQPQASTVARAVAAGAGAMPSFRGRLSADEIDAVAAYVAAAASR